jgi:hypothetical protein
MPRFLAFLGFTRAIRASRPSYAHHIHRVYDLGSGVWTSQRVQVTERDAQGRIRTVRVLSA